MGTSSPIYKKKLHRKEEETVKPGQRLFTEIFLKNDSLINKYIKKKDGDLFVL
jgi:hypothetical protein